LNDGINLGLVAPGRRRVAEKDDAAIFELQRRKMYSQRRMSKWRFVAFTCLYLWVAGAAGGVAAAIIAMSQDAEISDARYRNVFDLSKSIPKAKQAVADFMADDKITNREYNIIMPLIKDEAEKAIIRVEYTLSEASKKEIRNWRREK
jgi:hypothetical protein